MSKKKEKESALTLEETIKRLDRRQKDYEDRMGKKIKDLENKVVYLSNKLNNLDGSSKEESVSYQDKICQLEETVSGFDERIENVLMVTENIQEKLFDFDLNKKNNLIVHGVASVAGETGEQLRAAVADILRTRLRILRQVELSGVSRVRTGPAVRGCRPLLITFTHFKDREEVLKASKFLKISEADPYITEGALVDHTFILLCDALQSAQTISS